MKKSLIAFLSVVYVFCFFIYAPDVAAESPAEKIQKSEASTNKQANDDKKVAGAVNVDIDKYVIGPEDVLDIFVWKEESLTKTVPVRIDGKISLPLLDDIQASGRTPLQLKEEITKKLRGFVDNPTVTVTVKEANSYRVFISGEVKQPGIVHIRSEVTLVNLIIMAGGFTEWANKRKILIITKENGKEKRITANYNKIIDGDVPDIVIKPGDTVIIR
ncbi:MAG: polysaccharide biosynthesis/export family protein [Smithella sp.]